jgi:hypothetical protein
VASQDIGPLGPHESEPVLIEWNQSYSFLSLLIWAIPLVLFALKANRHRQAWLILLPVGLVMLVWQILARLFSLPDEKVDMVGFFIESGVLGWAIVWLLGHWLGSRGRSVSFFRMTGVMLAVGLASYFCHFEDVGKTGPLLLAFSVFSPVLPISMMLSSFFCRGKYSSNRFSLWLLLWIYVSTLAAMLAFFILMTIIEGPPNWNIIVLIMFSLIFYSGILAAFLYPLNMPFLILAFKSPFYTNRFEKLFCIEKDYSSVLATIMPLDVEPISKEPTAKPVAEDDLLGRWEFYLDRLCLIVRIVFWADGTFSQTMLANRDEVRECPGGTWRLEGAYVHLDGYVPTAGTSAESRTWWMIDARDGLVLFGGDEVDGKHYFPIRRDKTGF